MSKHIHIHGLEPHEDAFGNNMYDCFLSGNYLGGYEIEERDDGRFILNGDSNSYFESFEDWGGLQKEISSEVKGVVLDVGCGAGKHALYFQEQGLVAYAMDNSPLAIETCKRRGIHHTLLCDVNHFQHLDASLCFDTILFWGNNVGLLQNKSFFIYFLQLLEKYTHANSVIHLETMNPYGAGFLDEETQRYVNHNLSQQKLGGQMHVRIRYKMFATPWHDYLFVSPEEMNDILSHTSWKTDKIRFDEITNQYIASIIRK